MAEGTKGESNPRVLLCQQMSGTSVKRDGGENEAFSTSNLLEGDAPRELADRGDEEVQVEEEEEEDHDDVYPQSRQT